MTPTERRRCLALLGWTQREYARRIGWDDGTVRRHMRGAGEAPEALDAWLERVAAFMAANQPPGRGSFPGRRSGG